MTEFDSAAMTPKQCSIEARKAMQRGQPGLSYLMTAMRLVIEGNARQADPIAKLKKYAKAWEAIRQAEQCPDNRVGCQTMMAETSDQVRSMLDAFLSHCDAEHRDALGACDGKTAQKKLASKALVNIRAMIEVAIQLPADAAWHSAAKTILAEWQDQLDLLSMGDGPVLVQGSAAFEVRMPDGRVEGFRLLAQAQEYARTHGGSGIVQEVIAPPPVVVVHNGCPAPTRLPLRPVISTDHPLVVQREHWVREADEWYAQQRDILLGIKPGEACVTGLSELEQLYHTRLAEVANDCDQVGTAPFLADFPFTEYITRQDPSVRETHALMHGLVARTDWDGWRKMRPPNGNGCRCFLLHRTIREATKAGWMRDGEPLFDVKWPSERARGLFESGEFPDLGYHGPKYIAADTSDV